MSEERSAAHLSAAPERLLDGDGVPRFGLYAGAIADAGLAGLEDAPGLVQRRLMEKKWQYLFVATPEVMLALAVIDCGYLSTGMCAVFDRGGRRLLVDENPVLPPLCAQVSDGPGEMSARLFGPRIEARLQRTPKGLSVKAKWVHAQVDLLLDVARAPPPISAVASVGAPGRFDFTQKTVLVPAEGEVRAANVRFPVHGQLAGLDYTHGLLARETAWRWAFGSGRSGLRQVGFNFSDGFLQGEGENAIWLDGEPRAVGPVTFAFDPESPLGPWRVQSRDGRVDLVFQPEGYRRQTVDLKVILSRYLQPFGTFSGSLDGVGIEGVPGVTEDHAARW
ncbi:MAG TPA: DUF2804 domain-containing protein [Myxococcales bacterium]|nr:DUF2804 domain-containing protein [Myxococcales bacterium]